ncbi:MAG: hypothetical protein KGI29_04270 [Pseudomonadota bacterium]|nr:hypothetical protein [Pseudomonadota bacterium]MDE3036999.1 hypothetical protein [Pseudomonadota bacterium]
MKTLEHETRKITTHLLAKPLNDLLRDTEEGTTELLNRLIKEEKQRRAWKKFAALRGKVKFDLTYEQMKEDRE